MWHFLRVKIVVLCLFFASFSSFSQTDKSVKTIVIFFSFNANTPAYERFIEGFSHQMHIVYNKPCNILTEYLNLNRFPEEKVMEQDVISSICKQQSTRINYAQVLFQYY